jgi:prophage regulatory protein
MNAMSNQIETVNVVDLPRAPTPQPERLLRLSKVLNIVGIGKTSVYAMIKVGKFPEPRRVGHASLWVESEITAWVGKIAASAPKSSEWTMQPRQKSAPSP